MKRTLVLLFVVSALAASLMAVLQGCSKKGAAEPEMPTATTGNTATITPTWTQSEVVSATPTATITETLTVSPTFTETQPPYVVDNFESGTDTWTTSKDAGTLSFVNTGITGSTNSILYGSYALGVTGEAWAETGSAPYAGFTMIQKSFGPADLSAYVTMDFAVSEIVTFTPVYGGPVTYKAMIKSGANVIEYVMTAPGPVMAQRSLPLSGFVLPSGASGYTAASVIANADAVAFEVSITSSTLNDWIGYSIFIDNVEFRK